MKTSKEVIISNCEFLGITYLAEILMCLCFVLGMIMFKYIKKQENLKKSTSRIFNSNILIDENFEYNKIRNNDPLFNDLNDNINWSSKINS